MGRLLLAAAQDDNRSRAANICQFRAAPGDRRGGRGAAPAGAAAVIGCDDGHSESPAASDRRKSMAKDRAAEPKLAPDMASGEWLAIRVPEAAAFLGLSCSKFYDLVAAGH